MAPIAAIMALSAAPLEPVGKWQLQAEDAYCVLSHDFASADRKLSFAFRPSFSNETIDLIVISPGLNYTDNGTAKLVFGDQTSKAPYAAAPDATGTAALGSGPIDVGGAI